MFDGCGGKRCTFGKGKGAVSGWKEVYVEGSMVRKVRGGLLCA